MNAARKILTASDEGLSIRSSHDIAGVLDACFGADGLILTESDLSADFFNLRTGLAGEFLQKCVNYRLRVAIVLSDAGIYGERFRELAYEHARHTTIRFVRSGEEARTWLGASADPAQPTDEE